MVGEYWDYGKSREPMQVQPQPIRLLLVEDRRGGLDALAAYLRSQPDIRIDAASDSGLLAGVRAIFDTPDAVLVSADLVGFTAWDTVRLIKQLCPAVAVVVIGRSAEPCWWLREAECPDAIIEHPHEYTAIADLVRALPARRCKRPNPDAAEQTRYHGRVGDCL
jgi:DNA-binding NarL/FixJ family response regulator